MDLGLTRGDGVFETISVVDGHPQALDPHLQRLAHSATLLDLAEPDLDVWRRAVLAGIETHRDNGGDARELYAKLILPAASRARDARAAGCSWTRPRTSRPRAGHPGRHPRPRLPARCRRDLAVAAAGCEDALLRRQPGCPARSRPPRRRRRDLRQLRRVRARGPDLERDRAQRRHGSHAADRPGHPGRNDPGQRLRVLRRAGASTRSYERIPADELATADELWLVSSVRQAAPSPTWTARRSRSTPTAAPHSTRSCSRADELSPTRLTRLHRSAAPAPG